MANQDILAFIVAESEKGTDLAIIQQKALAKGWSVEDVNGAFAAYRLRRDPLHGSDEPLIKPKKRTIDVSLVVALGILVVLGAVLYKYAPTLANSAQLALSEAIGKSTPLTQEPFIPFATTPASYTDARPVYHASVASHTAKVVTVTAPSASSAQTPAAATPPSSVQPAQPSAPQPTPTPSTQTAPPPSVSIGADATVVAPNSAVTLSWSSTNTTSCQSDGSFQTNDLTSGVITVHPLLSTSYTITCVGAGGHVQASIYVRTQGTPVADVPSTPSTPTPTTPTTPATPTPPAPTLTISASPATVHAGETVNLTWNSTNATSCTASGGWSGSKATSGTQAITNVASAANYSLTCTGDGGSVTQSAATTVGGTVAAPTPTVALSVAPIAVASGGSATLTWSSTNAMSCTASGAWSGAKELSGSATLTGVTTSGTYSLTCTGTGGSASKSTTLTVTAPAPVPAPVPVGGTTLVHNVTELTAALRAVNNVGGGTILLAPGSYGVVYIGGANSGFAWNQGFTFPSTVTIMSQDSNNRAKFDQLIITYTAGVIIENIDLSGSPTNGTFVSSTHDTNITIAGFKIIGPPDLSTTGIFSRDSTHIVIRNNDISYMGNGIQSYMDLDDINILYNHIHNISVDGIDGYNMVGSVTMRGNYVHDFNVTAGAHPDCFQTAGTASSRSILDENFCYRGATQGAYPPQGVFGGGPNAYAEEDDNLTVCTLYNAIAVSSISGSGEIKRNHVIECPDYGNWIRYQGTNNLVVSDNLSPAYVAPTANTNLTFTNNATSAPGLQVHVNQPSDAAPDIAIWRAQHPLVPTDSYSPSYGFVTPRMQFYAALSGLLTGANRAVAAVASAFGGK